MIPQNIEQKIIVSAILAHLKNDSLRDIYLTRAQLAAVSHCYISIAKISNDRGFVITDLEIIKAAMLANIVRECNEMMLQIPVLISEIEEYLQSPTRDFELSDQARNVELRMNSKTKEYQAFIATNFIEDYRRKTDHSLDLEEKIEANLLKYAHSFSNTLTLLLLGSMIVRAHLYTPNRPESIQRIKDYLNFLQYFASAFDVIGDSLEVISEIEPIITFLALESINSPYRNFQILVDSFSNGGKAETIQELEIQSEAKTAAKIQSKITTINQVSHLQKMYSKLVKRLENGGSILATQVLAKLHNICSEATRNAVKYCDNSGILFTTIIGNGHIDDFDQKPKLLLTITIANNTTQLHKLSFKSTNRGGDIMASYVREINQIIPDMITLTTPAETAANPYEVIIKIAV